MGHDQRYDQRLLYRPPNNIDRGGKVNRYSASIIVALSTLLLASIVLGQGTSDKPRNEAATVFDQERALQLSQAALGTKVGDHTLRDRQGNAVELNSFRGKPLVISLIYTSCYHTCPMITNQLARVVDIAREALGEHSFSVVTIGFDTPNDTPDRMRIYAAERGIDVSDWWFLSADAATIEALSQELGFLYFASPKGFDHTVQTTIVDAQGKVYRQVYGEMLNSPHFVEPLKELVWGLEADPASLSGWLKGVRLICTIYDPSTGRYRFDYSIFVALFVGTLSLGSVAVFIVRAWRQSV